MEDSCTLISCCFYIIPCFLDSSSLRHLLSIAATLVILNLATNGYVVLRDAMCYTTAEWFIRSTIRDYFRKVKGHFSTPQVLKVVKMLRYLWQLFQNVYLTGKNQVQNSFAYETDLVAMLCSVEISVHLLPYGRICVQKVGIKSGGYLHISCIQSYTGTCHCIESIYLMRNP